jgi:phosphocarrier protein HPr
MTIETVTRHVTIPSGDGLHLRAAATMARTAGEYQSDIHVNCNGRLADAKSVLELLSLAAIPGSELALKARGPDSWMAAHALADLVLHGFRTCFERSHA